LLIMLGWFGHKSRPLTDTFSPGFDKISRYAIGTAMLGTGMLIVMPREYHTRFLALFSQVAVMLGFGVISGYVKDKLDKENS